MFITEHLYFKLSIFTEHCVSAFVTYALRPWGAPRKRCCARARLMQVRAWAARASGVRGAICAPSVACAWRSLPRALTRSYVGARLPASSYLFFFLAHCTKLCRIFSASVSAFASASAFDSALHSTLLCIRLCTALISASSLPFARRVRLQQVYVVWNVL